MHGIWKTAYPSPFLKCGEDIVLCEALGKAGGADFSKREVEIAVCV